MSPTILSSLAEVAGRYDALFCDIWGVVHNGIAPFGDAVDALRAFRQSGGRVVLITNAPRPRREVKAQLAGIGVPDDAWDAIATSGDSARVAMFTGAVGRKVYFIGEERDLTFFDPPEVLDEPMDIERVPLEEAEGIVCAGPTDPRADPAVWRPTFLSAKVRGLKMLCVNPDIVVDVGDERHWCAGALAELYEDMGGEALYFGKPHAPIYDLARRRLSMTGASVPDERILAIGDGVATDVAGAMGENLDCLFITGGLARSDIGTAHDPDPDALASFLDRHQTTVTYVMGQLR